MRTKHIYNGLEAVHVLVVFYYCFVFFFAALGLLLHQVMLSTIHLFLFAGIAGSQAAAGAKCPLTTIQNKYAAKIGKNKMDTFVGTILDRLTGWHPNKYNLRRTALVVTATVFVYYGIIHFRLL